MRTMRPLCWNCLRGAAAGVLCGISFAYGAFAQSDGSVDEAFERFMAQREVMRKEQLKKEKEDRGVAVSDGRDTGTGSAEVEVGRSENPGPTPQLPSEPIAYDPEITVNVRITFETNSAFIRPGAASKLRELCDPMQRMPASTVFNIIGHADASGSAAVNASLSKARAEEVGRHLQHECGIAASRFVTFGLGESRLLPGVPPVSEWNRRVEVSIGAL